MNPYPSPQEQRVPANGIELAYDTFGAADADPLLLIMGLGSQMIAWDDGFCEMLAGRGFRVVRFDNRDVGHSTSMNAGGIPDIAAMMARAFAGESLTAPYLLGDMAADAVGLLDALGIARAHIVGASMGGAIAQEVALRYPSRTKSLVSIMASSGDPMLPPPKPEAMAILFNPTPTDRAAYVERYKATWKVLRAGSFPDDEALDPARAERMYARGINPPGVARQLAAILASGSRKPRLPSLAVPTLVLHGAADPLVPIEHGRDVAATVPGARLTVIERMGHALPVSMWPQIVDAITTHAKASNS